MQCTLTSCSGLQAAFFSVVALALPILLVSAAAKSGVCIWSLILSSNDLDLAL